MKTLICLNCGEFYEEKSNCSNCDASSLQYERVINFSSEAYRYGYQYRIYYENQLGKNGKINISPSLVSPETYPELLAAFALGGVIGNFTYHVFVQLARKLLKLIQRHEHIDKYADLIELISNDEELKKFFEYISDYYWGMPNVNGKVVDSINEEMMADFISKKEYTDMIGETFEMDDKEEAKRLRVEIFKKAYKDYRDYKKKGKKITDVELKKILKK